MKYNGDEIVQSVQQLLHRLTFPVGAIDTSLQHGDHAGTGDQVSSIHCLKGTLFSMEIFII